MRQFEFLPAQKCRKKNVAFAIDRMSGLPMIPKAECRFCKKAKIMRIRDWILLLIVLFFTALIFYIVITEDQLTPEGWGF